MEFWNKSIISILSYIPDDEFSKVCMSNLVEEPEEQNIKFIKIALNDDKTKSLVCYNTESPKGKCLHYDINENILSDVFISPEYCSSEGYGINANYFEETNEYIFYCVIGNNKFFMKRIDSEFNIINDGDLFNGKEYSGCTDFIYIQI